MPASVENTEGEHQRAKVCVPAEFKCWSITAFGAIASDLIPN
ncbi:MAG: hypothetical protein AAF889_01295 [Cyanobacteria bacterium P01_D01_bin.73]